MLDCSGSCQSADWIGDGYCDVEFECAEADFDGRDCDLPPGTACDYGSGPGTVDCEGICRLSEWIGDDFCDDGSFGADFMCDALIFDDGDCDPDPEPEVGDACDYSGWTSGPGLIDCNGECQLAEWLGDDFCDDGEFGPDFYCDTFGLDEGDCDSADTEIGDDCDYSTASGTVPGLIDCGGVCRDAGWLGDGDCDDDADWLADYDCTAFDGDEGDCGDRDSDGYSTADGDCDDTDSAVYPGAAEVIDDGIDQDCDGHDLVTCSGDVGYRDAEHCGIVTGDVTVAYAAYGPFPDGLPKLDSLRSVGGKLKIGAPGYGIDGLVTISLPRLLSVGALEITSNPDLETIDLSNLESSDGNVWISGSPLLTSISLDGLESAGELGFEWLESLTSLSLDALTTPGELIQIRSNASLTSISFDGLSSVAGLEYVTFTGNASLCQSTIDALVGRLEELGWDRTWLAPEFPDVFFTSGNDESC